LFNDAVMANQKITYLGDPTLANGPATVDGMPFPMLNDGHSGWTITQIASLVPTPALATIPSIVLLMAGTNDVDGIGTQPMAQAPTRLGALIDSIVSTAPNALLVVAQITPLRTASLETQVEAYNAALPAVVQMRATAGKHVVLVDMHTGFNATTMLSDDGIHPNVAGYSFMGDTWYAAIKTYLH
jgi:lysophospholipase L1-like esterase